MAAQTFDDRDGWIWYDGKLVPWRDAKVHVLTHALHYASAVFEGERAYGGKIFKSTQHSERLRNSARVLDFEAPYSAAEIDGYLALADAQPTAARRMRTAGLVCLGAGAGLIRADLRAVRGSDVICRSGGVIVTVRGARPRVVPVLARYHEPLLESVRFAGEHLVTGGTDPARHNITNPLASSLAGGTGLPRLDTSRLRATWLADCARRLGLATFMHAAGITCSQRLGDITATLDPAGEAGAVALLGGQR